MFADVDTGCASGDGRKFATDVGRGIRLGIKAVVLSQSAGEKDVNDCLWLMRSRAAFVGGKLPQRGQMIDTQTKYSGSSGL
jgi:hypothetical protein